MDQSPELPNKVERASFDRLVRDSVFELILTSVLLFGVVSQYREMGDWTVAHLTDHPRDPCRALGRGCCGRPSVSRADSQSAGKGLRGTHESGHLAGHVALRSLPRSRGHPLHHRTITRLRTWGRRRSQGVGPCCGGTAGSTCRAPASTGMVYLGTIRNRSLRHGGHRVPCRTLPRGTTIDAVRTLDRWGSRGDRDRGAGNIDRRQSEPCPSVWASCGFGTNAVPMGVLSSPVGGSSSRGVAKIATSASPKGIDP